MELNKIYNCDCLEFMKSMPDKSVDLVLTDPPYGINISNNPFRQKHGKSDWDKKPCSQEIILEIIRVGKNQIIWGGNYFQLPPSQNFIVWDKGQPELFSSAMCEYAWSSFSSPAKIFYQRVTEYQKYHPTQKPLNLFCWIIKNYSSPSDLIFDPFMGSGTTAVAAYQLGRNFIGCEISAEYCRIANKRLEDARNNLFETANQAGKNEAV